jgi:hypothetical protein
MFLAVPRVSDAGIRVGVGNCGRARKGTFAACVQGEDGRGRGNRKPAGASWGGYESLALTYPLIHGWYGGALVRLHIGLEDPADLIADLAQRFRAALA